MLQHDYRSKGLTALAAAMVAASALVMADDKPSSTQERKTVNTGKTSGVIVRVESVEQGDQARKHTWRVTVNTDVVWRDFVRDQAVNPSKAARTATATAAAKGKESVATEGHPRDPKLLATVNVDPQTEITMRYRSSTDEISEGAPTPEGASKAEDATDNSSKTRTAQAPAGADTRGQALKVRALQPMELKPGLWIDVEYRRGDKGNQARRIMVIRPVGGADTGPGKEKAPATEKANPSR